MREKIAKNVAALRVKRNLKREQLSLLLGYDNSYISKLERKTINITIDRLSQIADFFGVKVVDLVS